MIKILPSTVEKRFRLYALIADTLVTIGLFTYIFGQKLDYKTYFIGPDGNLIFENLFDFIADKGAVALLSLLMIYVFVAWRFFSRMELDIAVTLFPAARVPQEWQRIQGHQYISWLVVFFYLLFLVMAYFIDVLPVFCTAFAGLYLIALSSQTLKLKNLNRYFSDSRYSPRDNDEHKELIEKRRGVAARYFFSGRHVMKEAVVFAAAAIAAIYAIYIYGVDGAKWNWPSFLIIVVTIVTNEAVTLWWRVQRHRLLSEIDDEQERLDRARLEAST